MKNTRSFATDILESIIPKAVYTPHSKIWVIIKTNPLVNGLSYSELLKKLRMECSKRTMTTVNVRKRYADSYTLNMYRTELHATSTYELA